MKLAMWSPGVGSVADTSIEVPLDVDYKLEKGCYGVIVSAS